jgi:hypothetical protein
MPLPIYESSSIARKSSKWLELPEYKEFLNQQINLEKEISQALDAAPSMYGAHVSLRARDAYEEKLAQNMSAHRHFQVRDQAEITSDRPGRRLHMLQFLRILNTLPRRRFILNPWSIRGMRGLCVSRGGAKPYYLFAVDNGIVPEWSKIELDEHMLPKRLAARGWRAVLLALLDQGLITETEIQDRFGFASGQSGALFRKYLFEQRNRKYADGEWWGEHARLRPMEEEE